MSKRDEIIVASYRIFSKVGYSFSLSDVAREVNVKPPSLYNHFKSKDDIIDEVIQIEIDSYYGYMEIIIGGLDHTSTLEESLSIFYRAVTAYYSDKEKLNFLKNLQFLNNKDLEIKVKRKIFERNIAISKAIDGFFLMGIERGEIGEEKFYEAKALYIAMILGVLQTMMFNGNNVEFIKKWQVSVWNSYWSGIKRISS